MCKEQKSFQQINSYKEKGNDYSDYAKIIVSVIISDNCDQGDYVTAEQVFYTSQRRKQIEQDSERNCEEKHPARQPHLLAMFSQIVVWAG